MAVDIRTYYPIEKWAQHYKPEVEKIFVKHCELVYKKEVRHDLTNTLIMTEFNYRLSDRGETLLALTSQHFLALLHKKAAGRADYDI